MNIEKGIECCAQFNPEPWEQKEIHWKNKKFVRDRVRSFLHIPLNFTSIMTRNVGLIEESDAKPSEMIVLCNENSLWGADVYIAVTKDVPKAKMATISGTFLSKVFEGPYRNMRSWMEEINKYVATQGKETKNIYCYYTTCPKCAKKFGKNYVVLLARV